MSDTPSTKPYLIRALYEWCVDAGFTPHLSVVVGPNVKVPRAFVRDGQIVLNIAPYATGGLQISNDEITCQARFSGVAQSLYVPVGQVLAIYARETGQGMALPDDIPGNDGPEPHDDDTPPPTPPDPPQPSGKRPFLRVVK